MVASMRSLTAVGAATTATLVFGSAVAQQQPQQPAGTVEIFACNFNNGQDMDDLLAAARRFNAWADQNGANDYTALILTPYAFSDEITFDALWLGAWPSGTAMGMGETKWLATGGQVQTAFDNVVECGSHAFYAGAVLHQPAGPAPEDGVVLFTNCSLINGRTPAEAIAARREWSDYMVGRGDDGFSGVMFPLAGESPDADYTYKAIHGFASVEQLGKSVDLYTTGGVQRQNQILGRVVDCDSPRLYLSHRVRQAQPAQ